MEKLAERLRGQTDFKFLELETAIHRDKVGFGSMVEALCSSKTVRYIYICGEFFDSLGDDQRKSLFKAISHLESLQSVYIANATFSRDSVEDLAHMLSTSCGKIQEFSVQHLHIPDGVTLDSMVESLARLSLIEKIDIGVLFMHHNGAAFSPETLERLCSSKTLQILTLVDLRLCESHFVAMAARLECNCTLKELHVWGEYMGPDSGSSMARMLKTNTSLQVLCLYFAKFNNNGVEALADSLVFNSTLKTLSIENEDHSITPQGILAIGQMLEKNTRLESLSLTSKGLDDSTCTRICQALYQNTTLKQLSLDNVLDEDEELNLFYSPKKMKRVVGHTGIHSISQMLEVNTSIEMLDISGLSLDFAGVISLASSLHANVSLQEINLGSFIREDLVTEEEDDMMTEKLRAFQALSEMLDHNKVLAKIFTDEEMEGTNDGAKINLLLKLNQLGLRTLMVDVDKTRDAFVRTLASRAHDLDCLYYLLVMNPCCMR